MRSFFEWFQEKCGLNGAPWLILGKGPSFAKRYQFDLGRYNLLSLNHAVREQSVTVAHMIDIDVVDTCGEAIERNAEVLVFPWFPHVSNRAGVNHLGVLAKQHPLLKRMNEQGRLLWYNLSTAPEQHGESPVIQVRYFSAEAALNLLASVGVRQVRSLGVDGGAEYSHDFSDLRDKTLLSNRRNSFDQQFEEIAKTIFKTGIDYAPLDVESPIRVYVATTESEMLPVKVLEYSIRKHSSMRVKVFPLHESGICIPVPQNPANRPRTPFSFQRLLIPQAAGYQGKAIYFDADMQVFKDLRCLWTLPFNGAELLAVDEPVETGRRPQFSVMLLNCSALKWRIDEVIEGLDKGQFSYEQLMYEMAVTSNFRRTIHSSWNCLERYKEGETALLHYTDMDTQPWVCRDNPLGYLWVRDLIEAIDVGFISRDEVVRHVQEGHVRASLLYQIEHRIEDGLLLPRSARQMDKDFSSPFRTIQSHGVTPWISPVKGLKVAVRKYFQKSKVFRLQRRWRSYLSR